MLSTISLVEAQSVSFEIRNVNSSLNTSVGKTIGNLLTELNNACNQNRKPNLSNFYIDTKAKRSIENLWSNSPFKCKKTIIIEDMVSYSDEYEVRNIPIEFVGFSKNRDREICMSFNRNGQLTRFWVMLKEQQYKEILGSGSKIKDLKQREIVCNYIEQLRTAYDTKDINFINQVFSDDALILVGKVIKTKSMENCISQDKIEYVRRTKSEYLKNLSQVFKMNKRVDVTFDNIQVERHPSVKDWYLIRVHQKWVSDKYSDTGEVVLVWNFSDSQNPQISVRVWQPNNSPQFGFDDVTPVP